MFLDVFNELLSENDLSKKKFSEKSGIPYPTIIGWTNLNRLPDFNALIKIADFFQCSVDFLMERNDRYINAYPTYKTEDEQILIAAYQKLNESDKEIIKKLTKRLSE